MKAKIENIEVKVGVPFIVDSCGVIWAMKKDKIVAVSDNSRGGGYYCDSIENASKVLKDEGYIE